jgi:sugar/nucleoside kinase (ribokinase family)
MKRVLTIGEILVEIMATEAGYGFRAPISLIGPFASGAPAIFIDQAARLGQPCAIVSTVGRDDFGTLCTERLREDGVDVAAIGIDPERPTGSAFVRYRPDGARDFVFNIRHSACASIATNPEAERAIDACDHLHVMGTALFSDSIVNLTLSAIDRIRDRGGTVSLDPNLRREMLDLPGLRAALDFALSRADLFMPSGNELFLFTRAQTEREAVKELLDRGVKAIVLKRGASGASCFDAGGELSVPGYATEEIDPTGAGDCFGATFVCCWLRGMPAGRALRYANAAGALAVRKRGPMEGASTWPEIEALAGESEHAR